MTDAKHEKVWVQNIKGMLRGVQFTDEMKAACLREFEEFLSEADKREREARAKALEEADAYHDAKVASFLKTAETAIVPSTIERAKLAAVFHEASASSIRALQSEER